ncbi:MAG: metal ABC transporter permease [Verrucomicrobiales bacterium]|jgi:zinc/manganese transport system permease protein/zinc transport system permease protein|nr:metal ABC transporter permease [Verrucomicrobiales bacterium]
MTLTDLWQIEFMRNTLWSALILGPACALLGVFVTLRGMAFFSDALAHAAVTGVALGYLLQEAAALTAPPLLFVFAFSAVLATLMAWLFERTRLRPDTVIAFSFTGSVALGYVIISGLGKHRLIEAVLFGSIYANTPRDLLVQLALALTVSGVLLWNLKPLALGILQPDLARAQGVRLGRQNYWFALLLAATVTVCLKMLGALLLSALIVVPAAAARLAAGNFKQLLLLAPLIGLCAAVGGALLSFAADLPTGPVIVLANAGILLLLFPARFLRRR